MATMTVNITESLTLNGVEQGGNTSLDITGVNDIYKRTVTVPSGADTTIATFRTAASSANFGSLTNIQADADTASCSLEVLIAST